MKEIEYLSPSSVSVWRKDQEAFYLQYMAMDRPPKIPQNAAMAVGSAFDAYSKSYLYQALFGHSGENNLYDLDVLFEKQVEAHNRTEARKAGGYVFECYRSSGALADLMIELNKSLDTPRFEFELKRKIMDGIVLLGKPDVIFTNQEGVKIILDWKVESHEWARGLPGVRYVTQTEDIHDVCVQIGEEVEARKAMPKEQRD